MSEADGRNFDGSPRFPSRFLVEIDPKLLSFVNPPREELMEQAKAYIAHSQRFLPEEEGQHTFAVGQRVRHFAFGEGAVIGVQSEQSAYVIQFDKMETPRTIAFRVKLEEL